MKTCFKCHIAKPLSAFYKHPKMRDGHLNKCKECAKFDIRMHRRVSDRPRLYDQWRHATDPARRSASAWYAKRADRKHPLKKIARRLAFKALRIGFLQRKPCEHCGATHTVEMHHENYALPLAVRWLCAQCHRREHHHFDGVRPKVLY